MREIKTKAEAAQIVIDWAMVIRRISNINCQYPTEDIGAAAMLSQTALEFLDDVDDNPMDRLREYFD